MGQTSCVMSVLKKIEEIIKTKKQGELLFISEFSNISDYDTVRKSLQRLTKKDFLHRLSKGIYYYPKYDKIFGVIYPSAEQIGKAIAKRDKARIIPTGTQALNLLGLSTQVPMKVVYLTDGTQRDISIGNQSIKFKKTSPKNLAIKGKISGLVIQALREIGNGKVNDEQINSIFELLQKENPEHVKYDAALAPAWISRIMLSVKFQPKLNS